jgi:hypothetical protein
MRTGYPPRQAVWIAAPVFSVPTSTWTATAEGLLPGGRRAIVLPVQHDEGERQRRQLLPGRLALGARLAGPPAFRGRGAVLPHAEPMPPLHPLGGDALLVEDLALHERTDVVHARVTRLAAAPALGRRAVAVGQGREQGA